MKNTIENTSKRVTLNGTPARIWEGQTADGIKIHAYITRITVAPDADQTQFERELKTCKAPSAEIEAIPSQLML